MMKATVAKLPHGFDYHERSQTAGCVTLPARW